MGIREANSTCDRVGRLRHLGAIPSGRSVPGGSRSGSRLRNCAAVVPLMDPLRRSALAFVLPTGRQSHDARASIRIALGSLSPRQREPAVETRPRHLGPGEWPGCTAVRIAVTPASPLRESDRRARGAPRSFQFGYRSQASGGRGPSLRGGPAVVLPYRRRILGTIPSCQLL